jgi:3-hydroxybutyryl-CoA dehydrogenase
MKDIQKECVIGAGIMGRQIALNAAVSGFTTVLCDAAPPALESARSWVNEYLSVSIDKGKITRDDSDKALSILNFNSDITKALGSADLVVEAIIEKIDVKYELFKQINKYAPNTSIITSNSSYISSSHFADIITDPSRLANMHYFNPAMRVNLVEIVRGPHTSDATIDVLIKFVAAIGKKYLLVNKEIEGFVVNRLLRALQNEAFFLLEQGIASPTDIDLGAENGLNHPMGPFRLMDLTGLDLSYYARQKKFEETGRKEDMPPAALAEKFKKGEFGRKTGKGWYEYNKI